MLRETLEQPGARAALVTPDRQLAQRVTAELLRFGVVADDSAGEKLAETPPALFLRLLAETAAENLRPVKLLALLKHPLAAAGLGPSACRDAARSLEVACLRGPAPAAGLAGLRRAGGRRRRSATGSPRAWHRFPRTTSRCPPMSCCAPCSKPPRRWPPQIKRPAPPGFGPARKAKPWPNT